MKKIISLLLILLLTLSIVSCKKDNKKEDNKDEEAINNVISLINEIPDEVTLNDEDVIIKAESSYDKLSVDGKSKVTNYDKLVQSRTTLNKLKQDKADEDKVNAVIDLIESLPDVIYLKYEHKDLVASARLSFNELDTTLQARVTNLNKLEALEERLITLNVINDLMLGIHNLGEITLDDEEEITRLNNIYNSLDVNDKALVVNSSDLEQAIAIIAELYKIEELKEKAQVIIDLIDALPSVESLTLADKTEVKKVRNRYTTLTAAAKPYVTNLDVLVALEEKIAELEQEQKDIDDAATIDQMILNLPSPSDLVLEDKDKVNDVRTVYDNSNERVKSLVTKLSILEAAEAKISELVANYEYVVKLYPNGGYLDLNAVVSEEVVTFNVTSYSTGFFSGYASNIYIYKTSLISSGDSFLYALKVGMNYSDDSKYLVATQIIPSGTGLNSDNRTSDYYILVHGDYTEGYSKISQIKLGHHINLNKALPDAAGSVDIKATVTEESSVSDYYQVTYKGITTLPIPTRDGYIFNGWYEDEDFLTEEIKEVSDTITLYASWIVDRGEITTDTILNCISDIVNSNTTDLLVLENDDATFTWKSSNNKLYQISGDKATTSRIYQTHKKQTVTVTVDINYKNGNKATKSKDITINPVTFTTLPSTPVATYFYTGALSSYKTYSARYKTEGTIFSESTKEALNLLYYSFATPSGNGSLTVSSVDLIPTINELKAHNVRNILVINGVGSDTSKAFYDITKDSSLIKTFVNNIMDTLELYNFDGVDIDWEYVSASYPVVASQVNALMKALREEMTARQDSGGTPYFLSAAIPSSSWGLDTSRWDMPTLDKYLDYINIMSYDANKSTVTTHLAPLYTSSYDNGYGFGCSYGVERIAALGFSRSKLIIGCAGYGKAYKANGTSTSIYPGLGVSGTLTKVSGISGSFDSGTLYGNAIEAIIAKGGFTEYIEKNNLGQVVGSYLFNKTSQIFITYDSTALIKEKYKYADSMKGVGLMCWAYTEDTSDHVINAIYESINK